MTGLSPDVWSKLKQWAGSHPYPLLFATLSGAHLYGFPSPDSDFDLRGVHCLPYEKIAGLQVSDETLDQTEVRDNLEMDLVTHDVKKFMAMLLRRNGYVLEQLLSPLVVQTSAAHDELKVLAEGCITRHHGHHYRGFARRQWDLFLGESQPRVKPLLYTYRVLMTGIHLMQTGRVEANLVRLNAEFRLPMVEDLVREKMEGVEKQGFQGDLGLHSRQIERLFGRLEVAAKDSVLPETSTAQAGLNALLLQVRRGG